MRLKKTPKRLQKTPTRSGKRRTDDEQALEDIFEALTARRSAIEGEEEHELDGGLKEDKVEKLIDRLYVSLSSIRAGNASSKLWKTVVSLLSELVKQGVINEFQRHKFFKDYHIR